MKKKHPILKSYVLKSFKKVSQGLYGKDVSDALYSKAVVASFAISQDFGEVSKSQEIHYYTQIFPFIGVYRVMQDFDEKNAEKVLEYIVLRRSNTAKGMLRTLLKIPMLYKAVPKICNGLVTKSFSEEAGFKYGDVKCTKDMWKADMLKCPYYEACEHFECPEITHFFCDSDDIIYGALHRKVKWKRTKTLGRGDNVCDFRVEIE